MQEHKCAYRFARMSTLKDRIRQAREYGKLTQKQLAERVGVSQPVISQLERGDNLQSVHLLKIAEVCGVDPTWLANGTGEGPRAAIAAAETAIALVPGDSKKSSAADLVRAMLATKAGKSLSDEARERLMLTAEEVSEPDPQKRTGNVIAGNFSRAARMAAGDVLIPQYDVRASMGHGQVTSDYVEFVRNIVVCGPQLEKLGLEYTSSTNLSIITGWGQSMAGTIEDKDPVIVDRGVNEFNGDGVYVLTWDDHLYIKRLQKADADHFDLISDNPKQKDRVVHVDEVVIHARVLYVWRGMKV